MLTQSYMVFNFRISLSTILPISDSSITGLDMQIYVDENHKYNKYSSYLFINENEEIVETPIIYKNDRVLLGIQHFMNFEVIARLPLGGEFIVDESYQKLFTNFIK